MVGVRGQAILPPLPKVAFSKTVQPQGKQVAGQPCISLMLAEGMLASVALEARCVCRHELQQAWQEDKVDARDSAAVWFVLLVNDTHLVQRVSKQWTSFLFFCAR